jgi:HAD superfamily hydrolase (TIGR01509 family)
MAYKNILWDLSGTLFKPCALGLSEQEKEDFSFVFYMWSGSDHLSALDAQVLALLNELGHQRGPQEQIVRLHTGDPVPLIIVEFLAGRLSSTEARDTAVGGLPSWGKKHQVSVQDLEQIERKLRTFFDPKSYLTCMKPLHEGVDLLALTTAHSLYILSNWDLESFQLLYERYEFGVFSYFKKDRIVISGETGYVKPQAGIYDYFLAKYQLNPASLFFIDDQPENLLAAKTHGIEGIQFSPSLLSPIIDALKERGIL